MTQQKHKISIGKMLLTLGVLSATSASLAAPAFAAEVVVSNSSSATATVVAPSSYAAATNYADNEYKVCVNHYSETIYYVQANESCESGYQEAETPSGLYVFEIPTSTTNPIVCLQNTPAEILDGTVTVSLGTSGCGLYTQIYNAEQTFRNNFTECMVENYNVAYDTELSQLTDAQIAQIETLQCHYDSAFYIHSLDKLTGLKRLSVTGVQNEALDFSANQNLAELWLYNSDISVIDLSKNTNLEMLTIGSTILSNIDLSNNTKLTSVSLDYCGLSKIDVSKLTELTNLYISGNSLKELDLSNNKKITRVVADYNQLTKVTFSENPEEKLTLAYFNDNDIQYIDLSQASEDLESFSGDLYNNKNLKIVAVPASWEGKYTEEQIRGMLGLDENQKDVIIQYGKLKVPNTGIGAIAEAAKYAAIVVLPAILILAVISKRIVKRQSNKVRFSR